MNLVEATLDGDEVAFGGYRFPLDDQRRPTRPRATSLGIRPEAFEDADFAPLGCPRWRPGSRSSRSSGSDAHVFFNVDAPPVTAEVLEAAEEDQASLLRSELALFTARVDARTKAKVPARICARHRSGAAPLLRPADRRQPHRPRARPSQSPHEEAADQDRADPRARARAHQRARARRRDPVRAAAEHGPRRLAADRARRARRPRAGGPPFAAPRRGHVRDRAEDRSRA